jgi:arsenite methyltransferase
MNAEQTKSLVREKYGEIARGGSDCCGRRTAASTYHEVGESYARLEGYVPAADLGLGCGLPTEHAGLMPGMTVLDLGSGAGNDVFVARREIGPTGRVIGVDFTPAMIAQAEANRVQLGYENVEFLLGEIEDLPLANGLADVVVSNCVLNLVPDKVRAFAEIHRVLKPGGHLCVSDIVLEGALPEKLRRAAELYVGCVAGALERDAYLGIVAMSGFEAVEVVKEREIHLSDADLREHLDEAGLAAYRASGARILSVTLRATRPATTCRGPSCRRD